MSLDQRSPQRLDDKVALITSSSTGICARTAMQLAGAGAKVMICGRDGAQGMNTVKQIRNSGGRATFALADIALLADVKAAVDETIATYGRLDILFNDVSSYYLEAVEAPEAPEAPEASTESLLEVSEAVWDRVSETAIKGTFFCCQCALPFLQQSKAGTIINLIQPPPRQAQMRLMAAICQGGIVALTKAIAHQLSTTDMTPRLAPTKLTHSATANLIWVSSDVDDSLANPLADEDLIAASSLVLAQVLAGPKMEGGKILRPFADSAEAIMYLAVHSRDLQGCTLWVQG